jgi:trehalose 6-phosphate phosphatase
MKYALSRESRVPLGEFARSRLLVAFDYDGTLAPLTANRTRAPMRERTRELLIELSRRYPCAVISGRARDDVVLQLAGVTLHAVVGNHGAELPGLSPAANVDVVEWRERLTESLGAEQGIAVEDKRLSLSVHYRAARDKAAARRAVLAVAESFGTVRVIGGKDVVNLVPRGAPHKGFALDELRRAASCEAAIYVGDDDTDEDVFGMRRASRLFSVRVGAKKRSEAEYYLKTQGEVDALISALIELREDTVTTS